MKIKTYVLAPLAVIALLATVVLAACNIGGQPCGLLNLDACNQTPVCAGANEGDGAGGDMGAGGRAGREHGREQRLFDPLTWTTVKEQNDVDVPGDPDSPAVVD
jgi:hypothetical protein